MNLAHRLASPNLLVHGLRFLPTREGLRVSGDGRLVASDPNSLRQILPTISRSGTSRTCPGSEDFMLAILSPAGVCFYLIL